MENTGCALCNGDQAREIYHISDWFLNRPQVKTTLVQCQNCGLVYQNPRPTIDEMEQHYPQDYEPYHNYETKKTAWLLEKAIEYGMDKRARSFVFRKRSGNKLLDVGCASGDYLNFMWKKYHLEVQGVEINSYAADLARNKYHLDVFTGTLEQAGFQENLFDVVTMWDVLEHLHDPNSTLQEIVRILKPGGLLALRVPNADSFDAKIFGPYWSGLDSPRHLYVFGKSTLTKVLEKNSFRILDLSSKDGSYLSFVLSIRLWMVAKEIRSSIRDPLIKILSGSAARVLSAPIFYVYSLLQRSSQMVVVAQVLK